MTHNSRVAFNVLLVFVALLFTNDPANRWVAFACLAVIALLLVLDYDQKAADEEWGRTHL